MLLGTGGLKPPTHLENKGADFIVGEAQHLAIEPNFGGPGLQGYSSCRHNNSKNKDLRSTPGRYIGKAKDLNGRDCFVMVLSTRTTHKKKKATSNVCSNQAFLAATSECFFTGKRRKWNKKFNY